MVSVRGLLPANRPSRLLALATLINTFGNGLFFTVSVVSFTVVLGRIAPGALIAAVSLAVVPVVRWGQSSRVVTA